MNGDPPTSQVCKIDVAERPTAINTIQFSGEGSSRHLINIVSQNVKMIIRWKELKLC